MNSILLSRTCRGLVHSLYDGYECIATLTGPASSLLTRHICKRRVTQNLRYQSTTVETDVVRRAAVHCMHDDDDEPWHCWPIGRPVRTGHCHASPICRYADHLQLLRQTELRSVSSFEAQNFSWKERPASCIAPASSSANKIWLGIRTGNRRSKWMGRPDGSLMSRPANSTEDTTSFL